MMNHPQHILEPLTEILKIGLINIRLAAAQGNVQRCYIEADHIHNVPDIIRDYRPERLKFYLDVEKPIFENYCVGIDLQLFEQQWGKLRP